MTNQQISEKFNIPTSTVAEWSNPNHNKHTIYLYLLNSSEKQVDQTINKKHRLLPILNRNIADKEYTLYEIKEAFTCKDTRNATWRQKAIWSKFFKECDVEDLEDLIQHHGVSTKRVKRIYLELPERAFSGVNNVWDKRFHIKDKVTITKAPRGVGKSSRPFPTLLAKVVQDRVNENI